MHESEYPPLDHAATKEWIYPTNYPVRQYQLEICKKALFTNTLVCLPTGLGKTLIAAVVMYNYYRWFPTGICIISTVAEISHHNLLQEKSFSWLLHAHS
jgi:ERCC4-related helicase